MDRSFDKKKIVNLQIAAEVTKSSFLYLQSQIEKKIYLILLIKLYREESSLIHKVKSISLVLLYQISIKNPIES